MSGRDRDYAFIRRHCAATSRRLFDDFDRKRRAILTEVAREFYPVGVAGLVRQAEDVADETPYDEEHRLLTTKPMDCLRKGAAGFHGNLTSPARRWFRIRMPSFNGVVGGGTEDIATRRTLDRLTEAVEWAFQRGGVYPALFKLYEHVLCFGFGCMVVSRDLDRIAKAVTLRVGTYAMGVGEDGQVCRVARRFSWTAEQILREFGEAGASEAVREAARRGDDRRRFTVVNLIEPNGTGFMRAYDRVSRELGLDDDMVYRSVYFLERGRDDDPQAGVLSISGFTVKPIVAPRLDYEPGDTYGRGRGMDGLDLARGAQSMEYDIHYISGIKGRQPLIVSSEFKDEGFRAGRGDINYARFGEQRAALAMPVYAALPDSTEIRIDRQDIEGEIADLFFNTAFATIDALKNNTGVKTATEVDALVRENMERLNPVVTNFDRELLDPLVSVMTKYTLQANVVPLTSGDLETLDGAAVEYVSQIHLAARQSQISGLTAWLQHCGVVAQMKPDVLDRVDADGVAAAYAEMLGVPGDCMADDREVEETRAARAEAQRTAQAAQLAQVRSQSLANAAKAGEMPTDDAHAGGLLMRGLGAGQ